MSANPFETHAAFVEGALLPLIKTEARAQGDAAADLLFVTFIAVAVILQAEGFTKADLLHFIQSTHVGSPASGALQ